MSAHHVAAGAAAVTVKAAPPRLSKLLMLEHHGAGGSPLGSLESALGFSVDAPDAALDKEIQQLVKDNPKTIAKTAFAVLDFTSGSPRFAGHRATTPFYPASIGKLMIMLGAYQLRHDLTELARAEGITDFDDLAERAATLWAAAQAPDPASPTVELRASKPRVEAHDAVVLVGGKPVRMGRYDKAHLSRIFDAAAGVAPLKFRSDGLGFHQLYYLEYAGERKKLEKALGKKPVVSTDVSKLGFEDRLALMIGFSHNLAPRLLAADLSMALVMSPLLRAGLYHLGRGGGLWLGHPYHSGTTFRTAPAGGGNTTATAATLVTLLGAIFRDAILTPALCKEVRRLLDKRPGVRATKGFYEAPAAWSGANPGWGTRSFIGDALHELNDPATDELHVFSKLGIYKGTSDAAYVLHKTTGGKVYHYALAILDVADGHHDRLVHTAQAVDLAVRLVN